MPSDIKITGITKAEHPGLYDSIEKLMRIFEINQIEIRIKPHLNNARVMGKTVEIGQPLIDDLSCDEIEGVLAHEFSHIHLLHTLTGFVLSLLFMGPLAYAIFTFKPNDVGSAILVLGSLFFLIYGFRARNWITLHQEVNADILAVYKTKNPEALQNALIKMQMKDFASKKHPLFSISNALLWALAYMLGVTHPELMVRIQYLEFSKKIVNISKT